MCFSQISLNSKNEIEAGEVSSFKKLCEYFSRINLDKKSTFLPKEITSVSIMELERLNSRKIGNASYSFLLSYLDVPLCGSLPVQGPYPEDLWVLQL